MSRYRVGSKKIFKLAPSISTIFWLCAGFLGAGCDSGERDLFTDGFNCEIVILKNHPTCGLASGAVSFTSVNTVS